MKDKFIEKSFQKFLQLPQEKKYFIKDTFDITEKQAKALIYNLKDYCYLITEKGQKFFDIDETIYDTESSDYERIAKLNRPKRVQVKTQTIHKSDNTKDSFLLIEYKSFHKHKSLKIPINDISKFDINLALQQKNLSFPLIIEKKEISFTRVYLYQPHTKTKIFIDLDFYCENNQMPEARVTIIGYKRKNPISKKMVAGEGLEPSTSGL